MRRAVISIPSNIAEGHMRRGVKEFLNFCQISFGSATELETQLIIAKDLGYVAEKNSSPSLSILSIFFAC
jgi:four helix bundle protein